MLTTIRRPGADEGRFRRKISRTRRLRRFRTTDPPERFPTEMPRRGLPVSASAPGNRNSMRWRPDTRTPEA